MKKLFDKLGKPGKEQLGLVGKTVMVGQYSVKVEVLVGEGGFASIYKSRDGVTGEYFALKHMRLNADDEAIREIQHEAKTMAKLKGHPNILRLHAVSFAGPPGQETDGFMLLDYCPTTLLETMQRCSFIVDDFLVYEVFSEVCNGVAAMHSLNPPMAHRDLKAENILRNSEGHWVICDFGSATSRAQVYETTAEIAAEEGNIRRTTTPAYRAPEMWDLMSRQRIDTKADIWAMGVFLYVLLFGKLPFQNDSKLSILYGKYEMPPGRCNAFRALVKDMLSVNPADRPDIFLVISRLDEVKQQLAASPMVSRPGTLGGTVLQFPDTVHKTMSPLTAGLATISRDNSANVLSAPTPTPPPATPAVPPPQLAPGPLSAALNNRQALTPAASAPAGAVAAATLIDIGDSPAVSSRPVPSPIPSQLQQALPSQPQASAPSGSQHKRGPSKEQGSTFEPNWEASPWGDQPAFPSAMSAPALTAAAPSSLLPPPAPAPAPSQPAPALAPGPLAASAPGSRLVQDRRDMTPLARVSAASAAASSLATSPWGTPRHSRSSSVQDVPDVASLPSASHGGKQDQAGLAFEVEAIKVQMKGMYANYQHMSSRVRQLEEQVASQQALIQQLQGELHAHKLQQQQAHGQSQAGQQPRSSSVTNSVGVSAAGVAPPNVMNGHPSASQNDPDQNDLLGLNETWNTATLQSDSFQSAHPAAPPSSGGTFWAAGSTI